MYHEMLFNKLFFGRYENEVISNLSNKRYEIVNESMISSHSQDVLKKCIEKDVTKRITAEDLLQHSLFDIVKAKKSTI